MDNFTREIRALARLDHPKLVAALDAGQDGNVYYLVTEYVPGMDLRKLVRERRAAGACPPRRRSSRRWPKGLEYAHAQGVVHRDVKPGNVLVSPDGQAKLSDLGLSGPLDGAAENDPRYGKIVGTADYLSPDQVRDPWTPTPAWDIYSLGCTLYYAVTGKVPFPGGTTADKARAHCELRPLDPRRLNPRLSAEFVEMMADMMAKEPAQRIAIGEGSSRLSRAPSLAGDNEQVRPSRASAAGHHAAAGRHVVAGDADSGPRNVENLVVFGDRHAVGRDHRRHAVGVALEELVAIMPHRIVRLSNLLRWLAVIAAAAMIVSLFVGFFDRFLIGSWHGEIGTDFFSVPRAWINLRHGVSIFNTIFCDYGPYASQYMHHPAVAIAVGSWTSLLSPTASYLSFVCVSIVLLWLGARLIARRVRGENAKALAFFAVFAAPPTYLLLWNAQMHVFTVSCRRMSLGGPCGRDFLGCRTIFARCGPCGRRIVDLVAYQAVVCDRFAAAFVVEGNPARDDCRLAALSRHFGGLPFHSVAEPAR